MRAVIGSARTLTKVMVVVWLIVSAVSASAVSMFGDLGSAHRAESLVTVIFGSAIGIVWLAIALLYWPATRLKPAAWIIWLAVNGAVLPMAYALSQGRSSPATSIGVAVTALLVVNVVIYATFGLGSRLVKAKRRRANTGPVAT